MYSISLKYFIFIQIVLVWLAGECVVVSGKVCHLDVWKLIWDLNLSLIASVNSSHYGQNGRHFADDILRCTFVNEIFFILIQI